MDEADNIAKFDIEEDENDSPVNKKVLENQEVIPEMYDKEWSAYVLKQFDDDELFDGNPTADGLRRVCSKLLGPIVRSVPVREYPPTFENNNRSMVAWEVDILWHDGSGIRTFGDVADVSEENTDEMYSKYAGATAATRAEGRALRKALQLSHVVAVEELKTSINTAGKINNQQISFLDMMCHSDRNNINLMKLINLGQTKYDRIEDVSYAAAIQIRKYISECQNGKRKIPEAIKGYDPNWRNR